MLTVAESYFAKDPPFLKTPLRKKSLPEQGKKGPTTKTKYEAIA
jgi:hypothetical protein